MQLRRKLYTRGSSFETTIPMPLLFSADLTIKHDVVFEFDQTSGKWFIEITPAHIKKNATRAVSSKIANVARTAPAAKKRGRA